MRTPVLRILVCSLPALAIAGPSFGCGSDGPGGSGGTAGTAGGTAHGQLDPGSPHTPATGCHDGFVACGDVCAHLADDSRHCGACFNDCVVEDGCSGSACVTGQGCLLGETLCDGVCSTLFRNADHCGSCGNRCADVQLCVDSTCLSAGGDGTSCQSPLFWDADAEESAGFRFAAAATVPHAFGCAAGGPLPTRWFRFIAPKDNTNVSVRADTDDYVIEVFSGPACDASVLVACNDEEEPGTEPRIYLTTTPGTPFLVAVGLKGTWSGKPAWIKVDH